MADVNESIVPQKTDEPYWYVVHTYSGYEDKVMRNIEKTRENRHLEDQILKVEVPYKEVIEIRDGKEKKFKKKLYPGYVLINMIMNETTWYIVRNTRGVTGFVGPGSKAVPLEDYVDQSDNFGANTDTNSNANIIIDIAEGDSVTFLEGVLKGNTGTVKSINPMKKTLTVSMMMLGEGTLVEDVDILHVKKIEY